MNNEESVTIKVAVPNSELIGKRVIRIKGSKSQINDRGTILEVGFHGGNGLDPDRLRIKWDGGVRTWLKKDCIAII
jgi:hypothetical protein